MTGNRMVGKLLSLGNENRVLGVLTGMRTRAAFAAALVVVAMTATGCISVQTPSLNPQDVSSGHTVLLVGDSLMGGAAASLPQVLEDAHVGGIAVVDGHQNGSGLARPIDGMSPADYVAAQLDAHPDVDIVAIEWAGACEKPCPEYGSTEFYTEWLDNTAAVREVIHEHGAQLIDVKPPPPPPGSSAPDSGYEFTDTVSTALASYAGPSPGAVLADWWTAFSGVDGAYYQTLFYDDAWHTVRIADKIHFSDDGRTRAATVLAAAIESVLGIN